MHTLSDVFSDIRDLPSYLLDTPRGVTGSSPLSSGALRSLRCDALGAVRDSTALSHCLYLTVFHRHNRNCPSKSLFRIASKLVTITQLSLNFQQSVEHSLATAFPCATCTSPAAPCGTRSDVIAPIVSYASPVTSLCEPALLQVHLHRLVLDPRPLY